MISRHTSNTYEPQPLYLKNEEICTSWLRIVSIHRIRIETVQINLTTGKDKVHAGVSPGWSSYAIQTLCHCVDWWNHFALSARSVSVEFSADAAWSHRHVQRRANSSKILKAQPFIQAVVIVFKTQRRWIPSTRSSGISPATSHWIPRCRYHQDVLYLYSSAGSSHPSVGLPGNDASSEA